MNIDDILRHTNRPANIPHIIPSIHQPLGKHALPHRRKALKALLLTPNSVIFHATDALVELQQLPLIFRQQLQLSLSVLDRERVVLWVCRIARRDCQVLWFLAEELFRIDFEVGVDEEDIVDVHFLGRVDAHDVRVADQEPFWTVPLRHCGGVPYAAEVTAFGRADD